MELAASGFNSTGFFGLGVDSKRPATARDRQAAPSQSRNSNARAAEARTGGRIIPGEVVERQTETIYPDRDIRQSPSGSQPENRRFSPQQAIQLYRQNEAVPADDTQSRQVSGIIDIYV